MIRTNTYITENQTKSLDQLSTATGKPKAEIIRDAIDKYIADTENELNDFVSGFQNGFSTTSKNEPIVTLIEFTAIINKIFDHKQYPFQCDIINAIELYDNVMFKHAQDSGFTTISLIYALHRAITVKGASIIIVAPNNVMATENRKMLRVMIDELKSKYSTLSNVETTPTKLTFLNGSSIMLCGPITFSNSVFNKTKTSMGYAVNSKQTTVIFDEISSYGNDFVNNLVIPLIYDTDLYKLIIATSCNGGYGDAYYLWLDAIKPTHPLKGISITWDANPDKDDAWKFKMIQSIGNEQFDIRYGGKFIPTENQISYDIIGNPKSEGFPLPPKYRRLQYAISK